MATHGVFLASRMRSQNVDALNRNAIAEVDIDNGMAVTLGDLSENSSESQVFKATLANAGETGLWIVDEPIEPFARDELNGEYSVGIKDPRKFYNPAGKVFAVRKLEGGDIFKISSNLVEGEVNNYVIVSAEGKYAFSETQSGGFVGRIIENSYFSIGMVSEDLSQRLDAYLIEVLTN